MKKVLSFVALVLLIGLYSLSAQTISYTVTTSAKCTNLTAEFTVAAGKVASVASLDVVPSFKGCEASGQNLTAVTVSVMDKLPENSKVKSKAYYSKTYGQDGLVSESVSASAVKLGPGNYVIQVSSSSGTEATLTLEISTK